MLRGLRMLVPKVGLYVGGAGILAMVILILAEIVSTKLFNYSLPYVLEYTEYLVPIIVFWGATYALAEGAHVRADILVHRFPVNVRRWIFLAGYVLGLIFLALIFEHLLGVTWLSFKMDRYSFYPTPSPLWPPQLFACIGLGLFILQLILEIIAMALEILRNRRAKDRGPADADSEQRGQEWIS
ncbi:TRAP transporter small permease subunit [Albidovulum sp.]|jgi:TRAP-type mannitol/chloroaromatic compound transport system permease small subunit|uniref:TRAP transporter small permease subunit n=1 Tax=Albidovulum sp. TaxID=1872424 RepID=UPI0039B8B856